MAKGPGKRFTGLSEEDRALWEKVTRDLEPLVERVEKTQKKKPEANTTRVRPESERAGDPAAKSDRRTPQTRLERGERAGVDRRQAQRLKRGQMPIDGRLDLHGFTQAEAHRRLGRYLAEAQAAGKRCVLVITGRGVGKSAGGVLKAEVPRWLNQPPNRDRVLAFDIAQPKHGGDGALYVLLRRNRPN